MLAGGYVAPLALAQDKAKPKHDVKTVMKEGQHPKTGVLKKILAGEGTDEDNKQLLDLFISLVENEPPKGDMASWQTLAGRAANSAAKVVVGRDGSLKELEAATNCKACHSQHKPS